MDNVKHRSTAGVGDIRGVFAGEFEAQVILRQQNFVDSFKFLRFVIAHPTGV